jgi:murein DD-endopeptidase MepM/ murein hydrolase activator NlpD
MKCISILFVFVCIVIFSATLSASPQKNNQKSDDDNVDLIENAIIIDNLSLVSDKSIDNTDDTSIIYDDSFDNEFNDADVPRKNNKSIQSKKSSNKEDIMYQLKIKDERWHYTQYEIESGDTLWGIARKFRTSHKLIISANAISGPDSLKPGKKLLIPNKNGIKYKISRGDTLTALSRKYHVSIDTIVSMNHGVDKVLKYKKTIFIPDVMEKTRTIKHTPAVIADEESTNETHTIDKAADDTKIASRTIPSRKTLGFIWPLRGKITSGFGTRKDPFSGKRSFHNGLDISAESGTPVRACAAGSVIFSGWKDGYGNLVVLKHKNGYISVYGHNSVLKVEEGDLVQKGDVVSLSGMTGAVTGAHLHFELQRYQIPLNPKRLLK